MSVTSADVIVTVENQSGKAVVVEIGELRLESWFEELKIQNKFWLIFVIGLLTPH